MHTVWYDCNSSGVCTPCGMIVTVPGVCTPCDMIVTVPGVCTLCGMIVTCSMVYAHRVV